jgi:dTMP kinase
MGKKAQAKREEANRRLVELVREQQSKRGLLIVFEGPEASGKTTQRKLFKTWLQSEGHDVVSTSWNSSPLINPLIQARKMARSMSPEDYCLLHAADFRQRLELKILPALWAGKTVLADRYLFTALARDAARGLDLDWVLNVYSPLFWPDMVFYFEVSGETSERRLAATKEPKFYEAGQDVTDIEDPLESFRTFIGRVIHEYEALSQIFQFVTVDAEKSIYDQHRAIRKLYLAAEKRSWEECNVEALSDWLGPSLRAPEAHIAQ